MISKFVPYYETNSGKAYLGDAMGILPKIRSASVDLILFSPPFALTRKKEYGNVDEDKYVKWFMQFIPEFHRTLTPKGSLVIDIGGTWLSGKPVRSLYHYQLLITLCSNKEYPFYLAQDFFWYNPAKLPTPAEWVTVRRIRVKDAVNCLWWLAKDPFPKANNRGVLKPYSDSMLDLLKNGYKAKLRPSGHDISTKFSKNNLGAIPPNLLQIANTESNSSYLRQCRENNIRPHPARFPAALPEFFIKLLTDKEDVVLDPFAGSNVTGEVAENHGRKWFAIELVEEYLKSSMFRFNGKIKNKSQNFSQNTDTRTQGASKTLERSRKEDEQMILVYG